MRFKKCTYGRPWFPITSWSSWTSGHALKQRSQLLGDFKWNNKKLQHILFVQFGYFHLHVKPQICTSFFLSIKYLRQVFYVLFSLNYHGLSLLKRILFCSGPYKICNLIDFSCFWSVFICLAFLLSKLKCHSNKYFSVPSFLDLQGHHLCQALQPLLWALQGLEHHALQQDPK